MTNTLKSIISIIIVIIAIVAVILAFDIGRNNSDITTFQDCVKAGNAIQEMYPRKCVTADNKSFTENIGNELEKENLIRISNPRPQGLVTSPITISGVARGNWYFEASFPVILKDANGVELAKLPAKALSDWMTEDFVPFSAEIKFDKPTTDTGVLVLIKDNPSGDPKYDDQLEIPVRFK